MEKWSNPNSKELNSNNDLRAMNSKKVVSKFITLWYSFKWEGPSNNLIFFKKGFEGVNQAFSNQFYAKKD